MYAFLITHHGRDEIYLAQDALGAIKEASEYTEPSFILHVKRLGIVENLDTIVYKFNHSKDED